MQSTNIYYMYTSYTTKYMFCPTTSSAYIENKHLEKYVWIPTFINLINVSKIEENIEIIEAASKDEAEAIFHLLYN